MFTVCSVGSGLCNKLILCDLETSTMRWPRPDMGCCVTQKRVGLGGGGLTCNVIPDLMPLTNYSTGFVAKEGTGDLKTYSRC